MTTFIIIVFCAVFVFYLFKNDRKDVKINVLQRGGMMSIYPKFVNYVNQAHETESSFLNFETTSLELAKNDGEYLEYKFPVISGNETYGYFFIGIQHSFGTFAYCYCRNKFGKKTEGFIKELHNGRNGHTSRDREVEDYRGIFFNLVKQMENLPNFEEKFHSSSPKSYTVEYVQSTRILNPDEFA
jgi:hypothetical protein